MRWRRCLTILSLLFLLLVPTGIHAESMDGAIGNGNSPGETTAQKNDEEKADTNTSDFLSDAIISLDNDTRKKEMDQDYIKNLYNSSMTAKTKGFNLLDGDSIVTCFMNLITLLLEMIGFVISFFVLTIYNLVSSSFLGTVIQGIFDMIDKVIFDWSDPNSWINKVLLIAALSSILYKLIKDFTRIVRWQQIVQIVLTAFLSMTFITFIGQNGRKIANGFENVTSQMLTETFVFKEEKEDPEIMNKQNIFDILQKQPFMVRHFGTTDLAKIAGSDDKDAIEKVGKRVQRLLNDPSQDNAEDEYDKFGNHAITHDGGSAMRVLGLSFVLLVHRGAISIVIAAICIGLGAVKASKYIVLGLSVYQLIWWLLKHGRKARQWFTDRLMWCMVTIFADILFSMALFFLVELCTKISAYSVLLMLAVDVILIVLLRFVIKNLPTIMS
ncbi:hypothetical protein LV833_24620, partial [[Clostridium] innocuum]|nr:hypothetical protein [[Clostridium] innocuum]